MRFLGPILLSAVLGGLLGCATTPAPVAVPPFDGAVPSVPERQILALTPAMERAVEGWPDAPGRVQVDHLNGLILHHGSGGFGYVADATLTAVEAFERREGNCLAFANLAVALGRAGGLRIFFQEATTLPSWDATDDTVIVNHHVNAGVDLGRMTVTLDVSREFAERTTGVRRIDDALATAHFYSNLGAEALLEDDLPYAYATLRRAIGAAPGASFAWSNLGLVLARNGQVAEAQLAYEHAIALQPDNYSALNNLAALLNRSGDAARAEALRDRVVRARADDPYHAWLLGQRALAQGDADAAVSHFRRAIALKPDDARLFLALAHAQHELGSAREAEVAYARARRLAPPDRMAAVRHFQTLGEYLDAAGGRR